MFGCVQVGGRKKARLQYWPSRAQQVSHQEVNLRNPLHVGDEAYKGGIHSGFDTQGKRHQKSRTGVSVALSKRTDVFQKVFFKKRSYSVYPSNFIQIKYIFFQQNKQLFSLCNKSTQPRRNSPPVICLSLLSLNSCKYLNLTKNMFSKTRRWMKK